MYNPDDDIDLDRLSREAAAGYEVPGNANWESMHQMLDKELPLEKKKRRFILLWWLFPFLLAGVAAFWLTDNKSSEKTLPTNTVKKEASVPTNQEALKEEVSSNKAPTPKEATQENAPEPPLINSKISNKLTTTNKGFRPNDVLLSKTSFIQSNSTSHLPSEMSATEINRVALQSAIPKAELGVNETEKVSDQSPNNNQPPITNSPQEKIIVNSPSHPTDSALAMEKRMMVSVKKQHGWSIGILGGIDKSTVKFRYGYEPGYNFGLLAGYHFSKSISVHSGAIYTQKNYKMYGTDFTAPKGSMVSYYKLETVDGYCRMWEVPILFRYTMHKNNQKAIFLSTGLSSYFMTTENYNYFYQFNGAPVVRNANYNSTDTHILSIVNLSVGFERKIGKQLYMQVEPYGKLPLGGVGYGNILLSSFGVNVSFALQHFSPKQ